MNSENLILKKSAHNGKRQKVPQAEHREERLKLKSKVADRFNLACKCSLISGGCLVPIFKTD